MKPTGGYRPIGLLASIYRLWAKSRIDHVREWASRLNRSFQALGAGKSTTDVAARVLAQAEAAGAGALEASTPVTVHSIVDIEECVDKIGWRLLIGAARVHGVPPQLGVLAVLLYAAGRRFARVCVWGCFSETVCASQGVLPGCAFAMFCLQCVTLAPFGSFYRHTYMIDRAIDTYVDDITVVAVATMKNI
eukprot:1782387-Pyramimonas_sp.AAC.1